MVKTYSLLCIVVLFFAGCDAGFPSITAPSDYSPVLLDVPLVYAENGKLFPGGWCLECALVMLAAYHKQVEPDAQQVYDARNILRDMYIEEYIREYWGLTADYDKWGIPQIHRHVLTTGPVVAYVDGWEDMYHAVVVVGIDRHNVYYLCPMTGYQAVSHEAWDHLQSVGHYWIWMIRN